MKTLLILTLLCAAGVAPSQAGEVSLTQTFQPFIAVGEIVIVPVTCYDPKAMSGLPTGIELITARNTPPSIDPEPISDFNMASKSGIKLTYREEHSARGVVVVDCTNFHEVENIICTEQQILRGTLECLRRVAGKRLKTITVRSKLKPSGQEDLGRIIAEFSNHPIEKPFPLK